METVSDFIFLGSKITVDGDCSHEIIETPWAAACQAPLSVGFPRQEYRSGLPFPPPGDLPDSGIEPTPPALAGRLFTTEPPGKP